MKYPIAMWLVTRVVILIALLAIAPLLNAPPGGIKAQFGWDVFQAWDSEHYLKIATSGYDYPQDAPGALVAFFPLFPLAIAALTTLGIPAVAAGVLINNIAFLVTVIILYRWMKQSYDEKTARWVILALVWCPLSLFGTVVYTEGLFLCFSSAALWAFEKEKYLSVAIFGSLATATRITGLAMIPAFILTALGHKKGIKAYLASFASATGVVLYSIYCWFRFRDPLAFINVQHTQWQRKTGFDYVGWWKMLRQITIGPANTKANGIIDPLHPIVFLVICIILCYIWLYKPKISQAAKDYISFALLFILWIFVGDPLLNAGTVLGGAGVLMLTRDKLPSLLIIYGWGAIALLLASGGTMSLNRLVYGIIPVIIALGYLLSGNPRWGKCTLGFFGLLLVIFSIRFAQGLWVA